MIFADSRPPEPVLTALPDRQTTWEQPSIDHLVAWFAVREPGPINLLLPKNIFPESTRDAPRGQMLSGSRRLCDPAKIQSRCMHQRRIVSRSQSLPRHLTA